MEGQALRAGLRRHRRLLGLCALSALVHVALLEWFAAGPAGAPPAMPPGAPADELVLRLVAPAATPPSEAPPLDTRPAPALVPSSSPPPSPSPAPAAAAARDIPLDIPLDDAPPTSRQAAAQKPAQPPGAAVPDSPLDAAPLVQMPGRYRVRMPDSVRLRYLRTRQAGAGAPERLPDARLAWRSDGERYEMEMDGVLGRLASRGTSSDTGVHPRGAVEEDEKGRLATEFADGEVRFGATGTSAPDTLGIQDRASVLMQLAGMGLAEPDQMQGTIEIAVAGSRDARIERYQVIGLEPLATPLGTLRAWHLAQRTAPGAPRLEVWLAPDRGWLPVQLRLTAADGTASTQVVSSIEPQ